VQWLVLSRDSLQRIQGLLPHLIQRTPSTGFPLPSSGRPLGHREAALPTYCNFSRVAHATFDCKRDRFKSTSARCNFSRIATRPPESKRPPCGKPAFLWETPPQSSSWQQQDSRTEGGGDFNPGMKPAELGSALQVAEKLTVKPILYRPVTGHDFSRADKASGTGWASAPAEPILRFRPVPMPFPQPL
jgi:hypothetical protein